MLPDLDSDVDVEIVPENLNAAQAIYFSYMLEQMRLFQVVERIAELFQQGLMPLGQGSTAKALLNAPAGERISAQERADLYARMFGAPGVTSDEGEPNQEFLSLWLRFLVRVAMFSRQHGAQALLVPPTPANAGVRRAARELAANVSLHGFGMAYYAARLAVEVERLTAVLSDPEIRSTFGARDMWQVIDQVTRQYLGGAVNAARYRTQARAGSTALQWLAANAERLSDPLNPADTTAPNVTPNGGASPKDGDLVDAAEQWLAASGLADESVDETSQPDESPSDSCPPIDLPSIAVDLLQATGLTFAEGRGGNVAEGSRGVVALFHGAAGTGKTLAAHVLAAALARDIVRVDLSRVVSKYIGETEKNLDAVFAQAEQSDAVLFFDEADALFGRRSEVKDAHDRYANLDVADLLQRIETYEGVVVLASNCLPEADDALSDELWRRRLRQVVRFPRARRWTP